MRVCRRAKKGKIGETSSKYGYSNGAVLFEEDIKAKQERANRLWEEFVDFMKSRDITPNELRSMFVRYYEEFLQ